MYPLLAAYIRRHIDAMELLLEHGADHNIKLEHKWQRHSQIQTWYRMETLIDLAVIEECIPAIKLLLKYGATISNVFIDRIFSYPYAEVASLLLPDMTQDQIETYYHIAVTNSNTKTLDVMLEYGISPNIVDVNGNTPLHIASRRGNLEMVKFLLTRGADINAVDHIGNTPLHLASMYKRTSIVEHLVTNGADLTITNTMDMIPIMPIQTTTRPLNIPLSEESTYDIYMCV
jgi:ankyrin repeat protein